jgi:hypothetical protein
MSEEPMNPQDLNSRQEQIEQLARATDMPLDLVHEVYNIEHAKLDQTARIKTYVPVLIYRHVKALLQSQRSAS